MQHKVQQNQFLESEKWSQVWWHMFLSQAHGRQKQGDLCSCEASLGYTAIPGQPEFYTEALSQTPNKHSRMIATQSFTGRYKLEQTIMFLITISLKGCKYLWRKQVDLHVVNVMKQEHFVFVSSTFSSQECQLLSLWPHFLSNVLDSNITSLSF